MVISFIFLRIRYKVIHYIGVLLCIGGAVCLMFTDGEDHSGNGNNFISYYQECFMLIVCKFYFSFVFHWYCTTFWKECIFLTGKKVKNTFVLQKNSFLFQASFLIQYYIKRYLHLNFFIYSTKWDSRWWNCFNSGCLIRDIKCRSRVSRQKIHCSNLPWNCGFCWVSYYWSSNVS